VQFAFACAVLQAVASSGDVRKKEDAAAAVQAAVSSFGKLDILINAAAGNFLAAAEDLSSNGFRTGVGRPCTGSERTAPAYLMWNSTEIP